MTNIKSQTIAKQNGIEAEQFICNLFNLEYVDKEYDAIDNEGNEYEIKSCQQIIIHKKRKENGNFHFKPTDYNKKKNRDFILVVSSESNYTIAQVNSKKFWSFFINTEKINHKKVMIRLLLEGIKLETIKKKELNLKLLLEGKNLKTVNKK